MLCCSNCLSSHCFSPWLSRSSIFKQCGMYFFSFMYLVHFLNFTNTHVCFPNVLFFVLNICCANTICLVRLLRIHPVQSVVNKQTQLSGRGIPCICYMICVAILHFWYSEMEVGPCMLKKKNTINIYKHMKLYFRRFVFFVFNNILKCHCVCLKF